MVVTCTTWDLWAEDRLGKEACQQRSYTERITAHLGQPTGTAVVWAWAFLRDAAIVGSLRQGKSPSQPSLDECSKRGPLNLAADCKVSLMVSLLLHLLEDGGEAISFAGQQ